MTEPRVETQQASDGYPIHVAVWPAEGAPKGHVVILHGVQSHGGWYHGLGRTLAGAGYDVSFPDRRGSGANRHDRGHTPSARRLIDDIAELLRSIRARREDLPINLAGISWGGKTAVITAARHPELVDLLALICPGLQPRVRVSFWERLSIAAAFLSNRRKTFPIPLSDPALFTANPDGQRFIAADPLGLHAGTAGLLAASTFIDRSVKRSLGRVSQPVLLMLAGHDRIVDNGKTLAQFERLASTDKRVIEYPVAHHTLEFEPDPSRYALDLAAWLDAHADVRRGANPGAPAGVVADGGGLARP
jgi:alpha-beta hydrolase superfamily lysophospholipase